mgnify:CR=1 FL=1
MSEFGIVELTRQRMRPSVPRALFRECPLCGGKGHVRTDESASIEILRQVPLALDGADVVRLEVSVEPQVANYLNNSKRGNIASLEERTGKKIAILAARNLAPGTFNFVRVDADGSATEWKSP